jgi:hypothetical protein
VARMGLRTDACGCLVGKWRQGDHLEVLGVDGIII